MIISLISDWEEPASQPDLSTNDSTFVPPAEEESDEEEPEVKTRQRRSKERRLRGGGLGGRLKMMLRLVGDGQHKLMRKRLRKVMM